MPQWASQNQHGPDMVEITTTELQVGTAAALHSGCKRKNPPLGRVNLKTFHLSARNPQISSFYTKKTAHCQLRRLISSKARSTINA